MKWELTIEINIKANPQKKITKMVRKNSKDTKEFNKFACDCSSVLFSSLNIANIRAK